METFPCIYGLSKPSKHEQPATNTYNNIKCLPKNLQHKQQEACNTCDCEHSDGCHRGYSYWHQHIPENKRIIKEP
jgi:hypothetical protein